MFQDLQQGFTKFSIEENEICQTCYNARLIKVSITWVLNYTSVMGKT